MDIIYIILLISVAGPIIGSLIGVIKKPSCFFVHNMLGFAAGVMLAISFLELIPESIKMSGVYLAVLGLLIGGVLMYILDRLIPHVHPELCKIEDDQKIKKTAIFLIFGIFLHNFPEGMAMAIGEVIDVKLTLVIALAIAIHNIPEGICTSAPYFYATGKRLKAFLLSSSTALPIILGFFTAKYLFQNISLPAVGVIVAITAGLMIYISADELIPNSCFNKNKKGLHCWNNGPILSFLLGVLLVILLINI